MLKRLKPFFKTNKFVKESYDLYSKFASPSEKIFDITFPFLISTGFVFIVYFFNNPAIGLFLDKIDSLNSTIITAIAILAGFNFAGVSVISSSQSELVTYLKKKKSKKDSNTSLFKVLMIFFTWSIVIELIVVSLGVFLYFASKFFIPTNFFEDLVPIWMWLVIAIWLGVVIHSLFLSIRNIKMLFLFITKDYKPVDENQQEIEET